MSHKYKVDLTYMSFRLKLLTMSHIFVSCKEGGLLTMSVESIKEVIRLWEVDKITMEQCLGKILILLLEHHTRLLKLESIPKQKNDT